MVIPEVWGFAAGFAGGFATPLVFPEGLPVGACGVAGFLPVSEVLVGVMRGILPYLFCPCCGCRGLLGG